MNKAVLHNNIIVNTIFGCVLALSKVPGSI